MIKRLIEDFIDEPLSATAVICCLGWAVVRWINHDMNGAEHMVIMALVISATRNRKDEDDG